MDIAKILNYQIDKNRRISIKEKAAKALAGFFALMILFTLLSRSALGLTIPKVTADSPIASVINHDTNISGQISANRDVIISVQPNIKVASVSISEGQPVSAGDTLFQLDTEDLEQQIQEQKDALDKMELQQTDIKSEKELEANHRQLTAQRASEDYARTVSSTGKTIQVAAEEMNEAKALLDREKAATLAAQNSIPSSTPIKRAIEDYNTAVAEADKRVQRAKDEMNASQDNLEKMRTQIQAAQTQQISQRQKTIDRAVQDFNLINSSENKNVGRAYNAMYEAKQKVDKYSGTDPAELEALKADYSEKSQAYDDAQENRDRALLTAQRAIDDANAIQIPDISGQLKDLSDDYNTKKQAYQDAVDNKKSVATTAQRAVDDAYASSSEKLASLDSDYKVKKQAYEDALDSKNSSMLSAERAVDDANRAVASDHSADIAEIDLNQMKQKVAIMEELKKNNGIVKAPKSGTVKELTVTPGQRTSDGVAVILKDSASGYCFKAQVDEEQAKYINVGDTAALKINGEDKKLEGLKITSKYETTDRAGTYEISVNIPAGTSGNPGSTATVEIKKQSEKYNACVPLSALHMEDSKTYVLVLMDKSTVLGSETVAERVDVTVEDKNNSDAAISGSLADDQKVVVTSDKPVKSGDRVRLEEE
jgi:Multidrug resistance efflux pump